MAYGFGCLSKCFEYRGTQGNSGFWRYRPLEAFQLAPLLEGGASRLPLLGWLKGLPSKLDP